jgi:hypothetical protein
MDKSHVRESEACNRGAARTIWVGRRGPNAGARRSAQDRAGASRDPAASLAGHTSAFWLGQTPAVLPRTASAVGVARASLLARFSMRVRESGYSTALPALTSPAP